MLIRTWPRLGILLLAPILCGWAFGVEEPTVKPQPIPDEKVQKEAEALIRDFFKGDFARTTPQARAELAKKLLREAALTNTDLDLKFVLLREARDAALDGGHVGLAMAALEAMGAAFEFDAAREKVKLLAQLATSAKTPEAAQNVTTACLDIAEELIAKGRYGEVRPLVIQAEAAARNVKDEAWQKSTVRRIKNAQDLLREYDRVASFEKQLRAHPDDPGANAAMGTFLCAVAGRWDRGLNLLVKGSDPVLKRIAQAETAGPVDAKAQATLGDAWWQYGKGLTGRPKFMVQSHAVEWLQKALPQLDVEKQEQVSKTIVAFYLSAAEQGQVTAAFETGNVALAKRGALLSRVGGGGVLTPEQHAEMIDGVTTGYTGDAGYTWHPFPCAWVLTFPKAFILREIRMLLWDGESERFYRYVLETSLDGKTYEMVADCSKGEWRSWQTVKFDPRLVKYIRLKGLHNSANQGFHVVELEAYCVPPATPVTPKYPSNAQNKSGGERSPERRKPN